MKKYRIQVYFEYEGYNIHGNIFRVLYEFIKNIDSGASVKVTRI